MKLSYLCVAASLALAACNGSSTKKEMTENKTAATYSKDFEVGAEEFGDLQMLRYEAPGFS